MTPPENRALPIPHLLLALLVVGIWGTNFVVIHVGLARFPAMTFAALRFSLVSLPLLPFVPWPNAARRPVIVYGLLIGLGQFGLMLFAMQGHISPGLASLLIQAQAFFTVAIAVLAAGERLSARDYAGLALCLAGVLLVSVHTGHDADALGIVLVLAAALAWGIANVVARGLGRVNPLALIVWSNLFAVPPLIVAALWFDGPRTIYSSVMSAGASAWASALWQSFGNALFGYAAWNWLIARHPASRVAPLGLLVPFFGLGASALVLGESLPAWKVGAAGMVVAGLAVTILPPRRQGAQAVSLPKG